MSSSGSQQSIFLSIVSVVVKMADGMAPKFFLILLQAHINCSRNLSKALNKAFLKAFEREP